MLIQKSSQYSSIEGVLENALYVVLECALKISLSEEQKKYKKSEGKDAFDVAVDG